MAEASTEAHKAFVWNAPASVDEKYVKKLLKRKIISSWAAGALFDDGWKCTTFEDLVGLLRWLSVCVFAAYEEFMDAEFREETVVMKSVAEDLAHLRKEGVVYGILRKELEQLINEENIFKAKSRQIENALLSGEKVFESFEDCYRAAKAFRHDSVVHADQNLKKSILIQDPGEFQATAVKIVNVCYMMHLCSLNLYFNTSDSPANTSIRHPGTKRTVNERKALVVFALRGLINANRWRVKIEELFRHRFKEAGDHATQVRSLATGFLQNARCFLDRSVTPTVEDGNTWNCAGVAARAFEAVSVVLFHQGKALIRKLRQLDSKFCAADNDALLSLDEKEKELSKDISDMKKNCAHLDISDAVSVSKNSEQWKIEAAPPGEWKLDIEAFKTIIDKRLKAFVKKGA